MSNRLICIKPNCGKSYLSEDEDPYYCDECQKERDIIAKEVDKKMAGRVTVQEKTELQMYDEALKNNPVSKGSLRIVNAKDLGLL